MSYRPFEEAREHVTSLKLTDQSQFRLWAVSKKRPADIPHNPKRFYSNKWVSWEHFLVAETELRDDTVALSPSASAVSTKAPADVKKLVGVFVLRRLFALLRLPLLHTHTHTHTHDKNS